MNRLTTIYREFSYDGTIFEARIYEDALVEAFMDGRLFKSYFFVATNP